MPLAIDRTSYDKARHFAPGHGYSARPGGVPPQALLVHATHGKPGSAFASEANYLYASADVSAHYLVGKQGQCVEFLSPTPWAAWHSGDCAPNLFENATSIGIELHAATTEAITAAQTATLTALVQHLMWQWRIPADAIARHGSVAMPPGRKTDPATWPEAPFARWRATLTPQQAGLPPNPTAPLPSTPPPTYRGHWRLTSQAWLRAQPNTQSAHVGTLPAGTEIAGELRMGEVLNQIEDWIAFSYRGAEVFVWSGQTERIA